MSLVKRAVAKFDVGQLYMTRGVAEGIDEDDVFNALVRHLDGDWGDVDEHDRQMNDNAVSFGGRLLSAYVDRSNTRFWIITEADRSATTILLPSED
ncbi:MAG: hypothetical protein R3C59_21765 [Planctomycetaceae bacterium]